MDRTVGEVFQDCDACPEMVVVPAGTFMMGAPESERNSSDDERPVHRVTIPQPFAVGKYQVTVRQYAYFSDLTGYITPAGELFCDDECENAWRDPSFVQGDEDHPVVYVSWEDAQAYVRWLSSKTGENYRLLTESEWEYVARAGTTGPFHFGSTISTDQANYDGDHTYGNGQKGVFRRETIPIGSFPTNDFGLHDVHGNVFQWVEDRWHCDYDGWIDEYDTAPSDGSAWTSDDEIDERVIRGGCFVDEPWLLRSAARSAYEEWRRAFYIGFRVAQTLVP